MMFARRRPDWFRMLVAPSRAQSRGVLVRVAIFGTLAMGVALAHQANIDVALTDGAHDIAGAVLGLVLAFRTNTAFARFWEARTLWGTMVNASRNLARAVTTHAMISDDDKRSFSCWIVAFVVASRNRLRLEPLEPHVDEILGHDAATSMRLAPHPALAAANELSHRIASMRTNAAVDPMIGMHLERQVAQLVDTLGGSERIRSTPTPLGYLLLLRRGILVFLGTLPFAAVERIDAMTPLVVMAVAYFVLTIEGLGNELDDPFGRDLNDLPLDTITATIERDLLGSAPSPLRLTSNLRIDPCADSGLDVAAGDRDRSDAPIERPVG